MSEAYGMSERCGDCWQIEGKHKYWCSVLIRKETRRKAFLEAAELAMKGSLVWANETELAELLREKAEE